MLLRDLLLRGCYSSDGYNIEDVDFKFIIKPENVTWHDPSWPLMNERWPTNQIAMEYWEYTLTKDDEEVFVTKWATIKVPASCRQKQTARTVSDGCL
jgi:hypothetical protein